MPQISIFFGIIVRMYFDDHNLHIFKPSYAEHQAIIDILKLELWSGYLPPRALGLVIEWAAIHQTELMDNWNKATRQEKLLPIKPLV